MMFRSIQRKWRGLQLHASVSSGRGSKRRRFGIGLILAAICGSINGVDWPCWRGPEHNGKSLEGVAPISWSETSNIVWKVPVPGRGHSSPVVMGQHVFLTSADEQKEVQSAYCFDRSTGQLRWERLIHRGAFVPRHPENSQASATPVCDGERVYVVFLNGGALHATALEVADGRVVWQRNLGPYDLAPSHEGYGSSPALHESMLIISADHRHSGFLVAVDSRTGKDRWRTERPSTGSFGTPIVATVAGKPQILLGGTGQVAGYDPANGKLLWFCRGTAAATANTVAFSGDSVFASGGAPEKDMLCVRADGSGDVSSTHVRWRTNRGVPYVPSLLFHRGQLFCVNDSGIARCLDADTGQIIWEERLRGNFKASPVWQQGRIYISNESGKTFVFRAGPRFELLAENSLPEGAVASPALCGDRIFLRTRQHLYCIGTAVK